jgi:nucleoside 2-deoxyribosyltransferase
MTRPIVYLSGPIGNCTPVQVHAWRDKFTLMWGDDAVRNPCRRTYTTDQNYSHANDIVEIDKADIDDSDAVVVNISDPPVGHQMWGTPMEILYACEQGKTVVIITKDPKTLSPWVIYHMTKAVTSVEEAVHYLEEFYAEELNETV